MIFDFNISSYAQLENISQGTEDMFMVLLLLEMYTVL